MDVNLLNTIRCGASSPLKGDRWTYLRNPATNEPIERIRDLGVDEWKVAIAKAAEYLMSDEYKEAKN